jgi:hypothetical protein
MQERRSTAALQDASENSALAMAGTLGSAACSAAFQDVLANNPWLRCPARASQLRPVIGHSPWHSFPSVLSAGHFDCPDIADGT